MSGESGEGGQNWQIIPRFRGRVVSWLRLLGDFFAFSVVGCAGLRVGWLRVVRRFGGGGLRDS